MADSEWTPFPGGELEAPRPRILCGACREHLRRRVDPGPTSGTSSATSASMRTPQNVRQHARQNEPAAATPAPLCFACYRAGLARDRALQAAGELDTATEARFQSLLPLEPVNHGRLVRLRAERDAARIAGRLGVGACVDRRRQAQIAARHALEQIGTGLRRHQAVAAVGAPVDTTTPASAGSDGSSYSSAAARASHATDVWAAIHAAELQLPETWLPFVTAR